MILAEVPAAAPALVDMLGPLIQLCALGVALASIALLAWAVRALLTSIAGWLSFLPGVGGVAASAVTSAERAISGAFGHAISGIESAIGHQWHNLSRVLGMLWAEQKLVATNLWHLAQAFYHAVPLSDLTRIIHRLDGRISHITQVITRDITRSVHKTITRVEHLGHAVIPRLGRLEHAIDRTIPRELKRTRALAREAEDGVTRLWKRVRALEQTVSAGAIATAIAVALAALGLDWLKCSDGATRAGRAGCDLWDGIGSLLGLLGDALLFADVCAFLDFASPFVGAVADEVIPSFTGLAAGLCSGTIGAPPPMGSPALYTPPSPAVTTYTP